MLFRLLEARQYSVADARPANTENIIILSIKRMDMGIGYCLLYLIFILLYFRFRKLVLIAIQDESSHNMNDAAYNALIKLGAVNPLKKNYRSSYAQIGWSGPGQIHVIGQVRAPTIWIFNLLMFLTLSEISSLKLLFRRFH